MPRNLRELALSRLRACFSPKHYQRIVDEQIAKNAEPKLAAPPAPAQPAVVEPKAAAKDVSATPLPKPSRARTVGAS
jgi:hypothetical protein